MSIKAFLRKLMLDFFLISTCVTVAMGILGMAVEPQTAIHYDAFFSPILFALVSLLPALVLYSRRELTLRQTIFRKALHLLLLEATLLAFGAWTGILHEVYGALSLAVTILIVALAVNLISWGLNRRQAAEINRTLKAWQHRNEKESM